MAVPNKDPKGSPESSLGQVGRALLKFFKPLLQVKAHPVSADPVAKILEDRANLVRQKNAAAQPDAMAALNSKTLTTDKGPIKPGERGSGFIDVKRNTSALWIDVVEDLVDDCQNSSGAAKVRLGNSAYQTAATQSLGTSAKTIGRILDVIALVKEASVAAEDSEEAYQEKIKKSKAPKAA